VKGSGQKKTQKIEHRYQEIEDWLRKRVAQGKTGDSLPSEVDIAARFEVSRMTARHAVMNLLQEGLVDRKRGAGTFIAEKPLHRREGFLLSFTEDMARRGLAPSSRIISGKIESASKNDQSALGIPKSSKCVVIKRIRLADNRPLALERVALIPEAKDVLKYDLVNGSLHDALRHVGFAPYVANGWLSARVANASEAKFLEIPVRSPLLVETRCIEDANGNYLEFTETAYVATRYVVDIRLNFAPAFLAPFNAAPIAPA
jgi:GntR family transcriptional regulator